MFIYRNVHKTFHNLSPSFFSKPIFTTSTITIIHLNFNYSFC